MTKDIEETITLLDNEMKKKNKGVSFDKYQKVYAVTNENLNGLFSSIDLSNVSNFLTVSSSGDQAFNLITKGVLNIDTFDSNIITNYYAFGLKKAAILKYTYHEYLLFIKKIFDKETNIEELYQLLTDLLPYMDKEYREYWKELISFGYKNNINIMILMCFNIIDLENKSEKNNYLVNEESYNTLKNNLHKSNISFRYLNYYELEKLNKKYDMAYFSNIPDYLYKKYGFFWDYDSLEEEYSRLLPLIKDDSFIIMSYLYKCYHRNQMNQFLFNSSSVTLSDLKDEEIILFDCVTFDKRLSSINDGALIKRK